MGKVRSKGNVSTEWRVEVALLGAGILGWSKHPRGIAGKPDFYFAESRIAVFVDGCFWHACPKCRRRIPRTRQTFWTRKLEENRLRDTRTRRALRKDGIRYLRIWEHEVSQTSWLRRLRAVVGASQLEGYPK